MSVLIGLVDQEVLNDDSISWENNKIGGLPKWMHSKNCKAECCLCGQPMSLVTQIYCPLNASPYHRCLYVFLCSKKECNKQQKGWRVFRSQLFDTTYEMNEDGKTMQSSTDLFKETWNDDQDDWGDGLEDSTGFVHESHNLSEAGTSKTQSNSSCGQDELEVDKHFLTAKHAVLALSQLTISDSVDDRFQPLTKTSNLTDAPGDPSDSNILMEEVDLPDSHRLSAMAEFLNTNDKLVLEKTSASVCGPAVFKSYYLSVIEEPPEVTSVDVHVENLIRKYEQDEGKQLDELLKESSRPDKQKHGEHYEKTELKHGDKMFHKFLKRLQRCPEQLIRYHRSGEPMLVSTMDRSVTDLKCQYCDSQRIFELQLLPSLIPLLKTVDGSDVEVEYGTVLVYTCQNNCWPVTSLFTLVEEFIMLQTDPDNQFFR